MVQLCVCRKVQLIIWQLLTQIVRYVWLSGRAVREQVEGSNPSCRAAKCNLEQVVYARASVTKQYNLVPANRGWGGNRGPGRNYRQPDAGFMASVTCRLTAEDRDQPWNLRPFQVWDYLFIYLYDMIALQRFDFTINGMSIVNIYRLIRHVVLLCNIMLV